MYHINANTDENRLDKLGFILMNLIRAFFDSMQTLVIALAIFVVVYLWILSPHQVAGRSMLPTFEEKDILLADKLISKTAGYKRGDVIIFKYDENRDFIKRIIALPGERIKLSAGHVFVNDKQLNETYTFSQDDTFATNPNFMNNDEEKTVPENSYFVMGDNREESTDSRIIGFINPSQHEIKGKVWLIYWPLSRSKIINQINY